jgi:hypothetical protein
MIVESYEDVIILSGALRSNFWETLHTAISLTLKRHSSGVIIDCSGLTEATPEGAQTFRDVMEFIHKQDARVIVAAVPEHVLPVLRSVAEVRSQLAIAVSVDDARRSLDLVTEDKPAKKRQGTAASSDNIVVLLTGQDFDAEALRIASQIGTQREAKLHLVYIVQVPRDLPLTSPLPKEEAIASGAIDKCKALLRDRHIAYVPHVERGRDIASALEDVLDDVKANLAVISLSPSASDVETNAKVVRSILLKVDQEVVFVRGPGTKNGTSH